MTLPEVKLRPATDEDYDFMRVLYYSTRAEEMVRFPFTEQQKREFLDSQFAAQSSHYARHYPDCERSIIERDGVPVGRLFVDRTASDVRIVDIALLPEARGQGIGTSLLRSVMSEAARTPLPLTIHVEASNRALRLYEREGFRTISTDGVYLLMEWRAQAPGYVNTASY
jgi:ribosomal protein S18 acetylase RimI-like enzyme